MITYSTGEDVYKAIRSAISQQGTTVSKVAETLGVSQPVLSRTINSLNPKFSTVRDIAEAIGCRLVFQIVPSEKQEGV